VRVRANRAGPLADREPPASLRPFYDARRARSVAAVRATITALVAEGRRVTLAAVEQVSRGLPEGAVSAKTVLRNPECRALYAVAAGMTTKCKGSSGQRTLRAELAVVADGADDSDNGGAAASAASPSAAELRRAQRLDRRSKRELAAMVIRLEREVATLHPHNANLRECLLRNGLGRSGRAGAEPATAGSPTECS